MIHSKMVQPRAFPWNSARAPEQINRLQEITGDLTLNRDKLYEIGRDTVLDYRKRTPSFTGKLRQFEYDSMAFWYDLANMTTPGSGAAKDVTLEDIKTTYTDISAYLTDDDNTFTGSIWFPKLRVSGLTLNIGDPDAILERNISLVGEAYKILPGKYLAYATVTAGTITGYDELDVTLDGGSGSVPVPVEYAAGDYIFRVLRVRAGAVSELIEDTASSPAADTWAYSNATKKVTVQTCATSDIIKVYYESATAYATLWTDNNSDATALFAEYCEIRLKFGTATRIYRLQSVGIDVSFERTDYKEIGSDEVVQTGVKATNVKISLDRFCENFTLEDLLASDTTYPYVDPSNFADTIQMQVLVYGEKSHSNFKMGYFMNNISPTTIGTVQPVEDYNKVTTSLECDNLKISTDITELAFA